jgi:RNA polymerase sigma-70 factor (sigma-E family)
VEVPDTISSATIGLLPMTTVVGDTGLDGPELVLHGTVTAGEQGRATEGAMTRTAGPGDLDRLYQDQYADLVRVAYLLTGDNSLAEDLAQEALLRAWRDWERIRMMESVGGYVRGIVVNLAKSSMRRRILELRHRMVELPPPVVDDTAGALDLRRALARLPLRKRVCVVLRYYADLPEAEIASLLGVSVGTVKSQTHKGLEQLRQLLAEDVPQRLEGGDRGAR